jgi:hypothetical protein
MNDFTTLVHCGNGVHPDDVRVVWHQAAPIPTDAGQARIEQQWSVALAEARDQGRNLFDGPIARLIDASGVGSPARQVHLTLGPGRYKAFVITRLRDAAWFEAHARTMLTRALGNSALLTHGSNALLGIRSPRVSCYPGRAHLIGGVLDEIGVQERASVQGLLGHLLRELLEEARVGLADLAPRNNWPRLLGIFEDRALGQPEAIWHWETRTPLLEIAGRIDPDEHSGYLLLGRGAATASELEQLTPLARVAYRAWSAAAPSNNA